MTKRTTTNKQRYQVVATYVQEVAKSPFHTEFPRVMGYYDAVSEMDAFRQFMEEYAMNVRAAQLFHDDVIVIPVPRTAAKFKLSSVYGDLAKFPNPKILEEL